MIRALSKDKPAPTVRNLSVPVKVEKEPGIVMSLKSCPSLQGESIVYIGQDFWDILYLSYAWPARTCVFLKHPRKHII